MFGDLMGNLEEQSAALKEKLSEIKITAEAGDGAIIVHANANRKIENIKIDPEKIDVQDIEQIEDLMLIAINRAIEMATEKEAEASQNIIKDLLPPGMGNFGNLFG